MPPVKYMKKIALPLLSTLLFTPGLHAHTNKNGTDIYKEMVIEHKLNISVDIEKRTVSGSDRMLIKKSSQALRLIIRQGSSIDSAQMGAARLDYTYRDIPAKKIKEVYITLPEAKTGDSPTAYMELVFHGAFRSVEEAAEWTKRGVSYMEDGVIGPDGVILPSGTYWYPHEEGTISHVDMTVSAPERFVSVSEGERVLSYKEKGRVTERWKTERPVDGMDLVMGRYSVDKEAYKGVDIYTFFYNKDDALSKLYIEKTKGYLDLYQDMIGRYPFRKFAVVEGFLPTGYGMPSFTLLGSTVLRLPFIPDTSLGHEIAHNWWGNSVFVDSSQGDWSEAITTYTADYLYARRKGEKEARDFRVNKLVGYRNFAGPDEIALKDFRDATSVSTRAVGYNKGFMVFNMLETELGKDLFVKCLKEFYSDWAFKKASWNDMEASFEKTSGRELKWFFDEWVSRPGGPALSLEGPSFNQAGDGFLLAFTVKQGKDPYTMELPVIINTEKGEVKRTVRVEKGTENITMETGSRPVSFEIDPGFEVFRILSDGEVPPSIAGFLGDRSGVIILPNRSALYNKYFPAAEVIANDFNLPLTTDADIGRKDQLKEASLFVFGAPDENIFSTVANQYLSKYVSFRDGGFTMLGKTFSIADSVMVLAIKNPHNPSRTICFFIGGRDRAGMEETAKRIRYFADSGYIVFTKGGVEKGGFTARNLLRFDFK